MKLKKMSEAQAVNANEDANTIGEDTNELETEAPQGAVLFEFISEAVSSPNTSSTELPMKPQPDKPHHGTTFVIQKDQFNKSVGIKLKLQSVMDVRPNVPHLVRH